MNVNITEIINGKEPSIISVDIFDTVLLRNSKSELTRFYEIAKRQSLLLASREYRVDARELLHSRLFCSRVMYQTTERNGWERDAQLTDIFSLIIKSHDLADYVSVGELIALELDYEQENLVLNGILVSQLEALSGKYKVLLTSDVYFQKDQLQNIICRFTTSFYDNVYSSCDHSLTKRGGGLFMLICEQEKISPNEILHFGDNYFSDVVRPRQLGVMACHLPRPRLLRTRRKIDEFLARINLQKWLI